jgi:adenine-specific DNA-methyltransferase
LPILKEDYEKAIKTQDKKPTHILIEGDNYHALTCLNYTHKNKIDVIYIDPPYNTGSDEFKYKDKRFLDKFPDGSKVPKDHPFRHSYWLSFMWKRLELAKELMKDSGVIFISIDINELTQLKSLCDDIFGENNLVSLISIKVKDPAGYGGGNFVFDVTEYLLMYAKNINIFRSINLESPIEIDPEPLTEQIKNYGKIMTNFGEPKLVKEVQLQNAGLVKIFKCENYSTENTTKLTLKDYVKNRDRIFADYNPADGVVSATWNKIPPKGLSYLEYRPIKGKNAGKLFKNYLLNRRTLSFLSTITHYEDGELYKKRRLTNLWKVSNSSLHLEGKVDFPNGKKPLKLLQKILGMFKIKNAIILDFFAGSGTTGEAVMLQNEEDGLNRQFILITNDNEVVKNGKTQKIMTDLCHPRIRNAIRGYNNKKPLGNSIKFYRTAFVGNHNVSKADDMDKLQLSHCAGELLAIAENTLEQVERNDYWQIFENENQITAVYFREEQEKLKNFAERIISFKKLFTVVYMFSWQKSFEIDKFENHKNVILKSIPQPILEIYRQIHNLV